jgi:hypothetical protein
MGRCISFTGFSVGLDWALQLFGELLITSVTPAQAGNRQAPTRSNATIVDAIRNVRKLRFMATDILFSGPNALNPDLTGQQYFLVIL